MRLGPRTLSAGRASAGETPQGGIVIPGDDLIPGDDPGVQPYKYGGKELDRTGGLDAYDFGARSYFADRLQWSTMDPLCEKYYDVTPYGYCHNDPVNVFDPIGMDEWEINSKGYIMSHHETDKYDGLYMVDESGTRIPDAQLILDYGTVRSHSHRNISEEKEYDLFELNSNGRSEEVFTFLADNTSVEWSLATGGWIASGTDIDYLTTSHDEAKESGIVSLMVNQLFKGYKLLHLYHSHTNGSAFPSGLGYGFIDNAISGDKQHAQDVTRIFGNKVGFSIYIPDNKHFVSYGPNSSFADFPEYWDFHH